MTASSSSFSSSSPPRPDPTLFPSNLEYSKNVINPTTIILSIIKKANHFHSFTYNPMAVGATTPFFTAMFAYLMTFKREAWVTYGALVPVVTGVVIASGGEPGFHLFGFIMCISATAARAFKSVLQGILLSSEGEKLNSMNLLLYMSPIAVLVLVPTALIMEPNVLEATLSLGRQHKYMWLLLLVNSTMAYSANLSNFLVTKHTSALTLQVLGNAKGAVAVVISILLFRNPVTVVGIAGYTMTVLGVVAYGEAKRRFR
ncbi:hypothetical protein CCACVL1_01755 [Corchorus capsularis]|uniref:Sugar phosphate transporter domain-containing protein n=1 Tax=Corchorus capsularis TaxID=210143 RepID=A0A1R3KFY9_COCAP|nr:hypothetical protein CCACVL1_01755 [Corchorus capsularis]